MGGSRRRRQDAFGRRARREGFPARSVYKLEEMDRRLGLLKPGARVLDLGAAPGSWTLFAAERVGPKGRVVGIDRAPLRLDLPPQASALEADAFEVDPAELGTFDVVLSDMAPATTGHRSVDQHRSYELFVRALELSERVLAPEGAFLAKIFQGPEVEAARSAVAERFRRVRLLRPRATRSESYETFIAGLGRNP